MTTNEKHLFDQIKAGNKVAFDTVFRMYYRDLCRFAMFMNCSSEDAEELVQDMFFKLWQNRNQINVISSSKSYLFTSVKNSMLNKHKHEKVKQMYAADYRYTNKEESDDFEMDENREKIKNIELAIAELPEKRREIFVKSKVEGKKYKEIADELQISVKTVENQMGEALKFLRNKLSAKEFLILLLLLDSTSFFDFGIGVFTNLIVSI
ncbi:MAG: RNA polymerase sigma-70 factor [Bacteroidales bacterium]|nr:RNA polymerase sigma-70 factor [Bacteroidales bacterium]